MSTTASASALSSNIVHCRQALETAFETLPDKGNVEPLNALIIKVDNSFLALIGNLNLRQNSCYEKFPIFANLIGMATFPFINHSDPFSYLSQSSPTTFYGSHHFAAFKIEQHKEIALPDEDFATTIANPSLSFRLPNYSIQRIPDQWVDFNDIKGLKFHCNFPPYMEIRIHQRESSLVKEQKKITNDALDEIRKNKEKQVELLDKRSRFEESKTELQKQLVPNMDATEELELKNKIENVQQKIESITEQLNLIESRNQQLLKSSSLLDNTNQVNAFCSPVLRALTEDSLTSRNALIYQLIHCYSEIYGLTKDHFDLGFLADVFSTFDPLIPAEIKKDKIHFFTKWINYLSKTFQNEYNFGKSQKHLGELKGFLEQEQAFINLTEKHKETQGLLSNENRSYLLKIRKEMNNCERLLDGYIYSKIENFIRLEANHLAGIVLQFFVQKICHLDKMLECKGLLNPDKAGEQRYNTDREYSEKRSYLDRYVSLLSYCAFVKFLPENSSNERKLLMFLNAVRIKVPTAENVVYSENLPIISLLSKCKSPLVELFGGSIEGFLNKYEEFDQMIFSSGTDIDSMRAKWNECSPYLMQINSTIESLRQNTPCAVTGAEFEDIFKNLFKIVEPSSVISKDFQDLKKNRKKKNDLIELANEALQLKGKLEAVIQGEKDAQKLSVYSRVNALLDRVFLDGMEHLQKAVKDFPLLRSRMWLSSNKHYQWERHLYWPTESESGDPFYSHNHTHISIQNT